MLNGGGAELSCGNGVQDDAYSSRGEEAAARKAQKGYNRVWPQLFGFLDQCNEESLAQFAGRPLGEAFPC